MEISVKQRSAAEQVEKRELADTVWAIKSCWCAILVLLILGYGVNADAKCPDEANEQAEVGGDYGLKDTNDANELWWTRWEAVIKDPNDANEVLDAKWQAVVTVLQNKAMEQELKKKIIDKIMSPVFDSELMAKLGLGRTNWPKLTVAEQKRFTKLFAERLKSAYLEKTALYKDEKVLFKPAVQQKNTTHIPMVLISNDKEVAILYKLHRMDEQRKDKADENGRKNVNGSWKIYDVEIEGVSIVLTYRSQFDDILRRGSVKELLSQLEKQAIQ